MVLKAGDLLRMAREQANPKLSQRTLADLAGMSQPDLSRIEKGGRDPGFATLQHLMTAAGSGLEVWIQADTAPHQQPGLWQPAATAAIRKYLPQIVHDIDPTQDLAHGPTASEALYWQPQLRHTASRFATMYQRLQESYSRWRDERDRDLIHTLGLLLDIAGYASRELDMLIGNAAWPEPKRRMRRQTDPEPQIAPLAWWRVVCGLRAEAAQYQQIAALLAETATARSEYRQAARLAEEARLNAGSNRESGHTEWVRVFADEQAAAEQRQSAAADRLAQLRVVGGVGVAAADIGTAGERLLALELERLAHDASQLADALADHHSFRQWAATAAHLLAADPV